VHSTVTVQKSLAEAAKAHAENGQAEQRERLHTGSTLILAALALLTLTGMLRPLDRDEGAFLTIAQMILHGRLPYRDVFDHKGPAIYYLLAGMLALMQGISPLVQVALVRAVVCVTNAVTAWGLYRLGARWWNQRTGIVAAGLWLFVLPVFGGNQAFTEPFAVAPVVWAYLLLARRRSVQQAFLAGALVALGSLFKQTAILALPGLIPLLLGMNGEENEQRSGGRRTIPRLLALGAGVCTPWLAVVALFALAGALGPMLQAVVVTNVIGYPSDPPAMLRYGIALALAAAPLVWGGALFAVAWRSKSAARTHVLAIGLAAALNLAPLLTHVYLHYWLQVLPWAALLAASAITRVLGQQRHARIGAGRSVRLRRTLLVTLLITWGALTALVALVFDAAGPLLSGQLVVKYQIAQRLDTYVAGGNSLLVGPAAPEYYFLAGRMPATAFVYLLPVNLTSTTLGTLADDITSERFDVIVWQKTPDVALGQTDYTRMQHLIAQHYHPVWAEATLGLVIYQRNSASSAAASRRLDRPEIPQSEPPAALPPLQSVGKEPHR
jgi:Dolichyl-phosphate-mannose-protein mannosyltransferase